MKLNENIMPELADELVMRLALREEENVYNEDVYLLYNPNGYGGVMVTGEDVIKLLRQFDGKTSIATAIKKLKRVDPNEAMRIISHLFAKQMLKADGVQVDVDKAWKKELTCWLHITNDCNLRCTYCYIHKTHSDMPDDILYQSLDKMFDSCKKHGYSKLSLMLVGGEPLTRFEKIKEIVDYCSEVKGNVEVKYIIPTNGTLITKEVANYIVQNKISVGVSLDGIKEFHDENRVKVDGTGSYAQTMRGIDNLISAGIKPSIMVTVTPQNLDGLPLLTEEMINKKLFFRFSFQRDTQTGIPDIMNHSEHCLDVLKECFEIMYNALINGKTGWLFQFGDVTFGRPVRRACAAGKNFFSIGQDGSIGSCSLGLEAPKGNISDVDDVICNINEMFPEISKTSACDIKGCRKCIWRHSCAGACPLQTYATYGTYLHVSPYCYLYEKCLPDVIRIYALTIYYKNKEKEE